MKKLFVLAIASIVLFGCVKNIAPPLPPQETQAECGMFTYGSIVSPCDLVKWEDVAMEERGFALLNTIKNPDDTEPQYVMLILDFQGTLLVYMYYTDDGYVMFESYDKGDGSGGYRRFIPPEEYKETYDELIAWFEDSIRTENTKKGL